MADTYSLIPLSASAYSPFAPTTTDAQIYFQEILILDQTTGELDYCDGSLDTTNPAANGGNFFLGIYCVGQGPNLVWANPNGNPSYPFPKNAPAVSASPVRSTSTVPAFWSIDANENLTLCVKPQFGPPETDWYCFTMSGLPHGAGVKKSSHRP
jgi:hypothetical protein